MLSIVPGGNNSSSSSSKSKSASKGLFGMLASSTEPKAPPPSNKFQKSGRRVVTTAPAPAPPQAQAQASGANHEKRTDSVRDRPKFSGDASIEELDRMLEDDALALINMRKEITNAQQDELEKARQSMLLLRKEYDTIFVANNAREKELNSCIDRFNSLVGVDEATESTQSIAKNVMSDLQDQTSQVLDDLAAEQRTIKMQSLMIKRLDEEIGKCRMDIAKANISVEHAKHDMGLAENNMQINRQYLLEQESQLEKLNVALKSRKDQRENKMQMLNNLSVEGEHSVSKLQSSLMETGRRSAAATIKRKQAVGGKLGVTKSTTEDEEEEFGDHADVSITAKRMNIYQIKETLQRFQSQGPRVERLQQLDQELRNNVLSQQKKKQELSDHLAQTQFKIQQLASNRQIYQEVDLKDSALAATSKECEESKDRDFRLKLSIEELKQSIPRFLTKVTKVVHPKPNENQLNDAVLKLEDELTKLIKVIGSALLKDATPDDLAVMSQQSTGGSSNSETNSEFDRLQRLPGFSRMQRQLFFNLMTAKPDISEGNVRIDHHVKAKKPKSSDGISPRVRRGIQNDKSSGSLDEEIEHYSSNVLEEHEEPSLGRTTIKNISRLIIDRDAPKAKPAPPVRRR